MVGPTGNPTSDPDKEGKVSGAPEALLIEQLASATCELRTREGQEGRSEELRALVRSLRHTLASVAGRRSVLEPAESDYSVKCSAPEAMELWHRGRKLPVRPRAIREALGSAGVRLQPGQVLLADREWARRRIEESLVGLSLEEFRIREGKAALLRALNDASAPSTRFSELRRE